jgi:NTP pyrophosphatase (non-canonical NTP hydrolase)
VDLNVLSDAAETISQDYARAHGFARDSSWFLHKLHEEVGELTRAYLMRAGHTRAKGLTPVELDAGMGDELADVLCHVLLLARDQEIDLPAAITRKWLSWHPDTIAAHEPDAIPLTTV